MRLWNGASSGGANRYTYHGRLFMGRLSPLLHAIPGDPIIPSMEEGTGISNRDRHVDTIPTRAIIRFIELSAHHPSHLHPFFSSPFLSQDSHLHLSLGRWRLDVGKWTGSGSITSRACLSPGGRCCFHSALRSQWTGENPVFLITTIQVVGSGTLAVKSSIRVNMNFSGRWVVLGNVVGNL
jgi:hypothetical protein